MFLGYGKIAQLDKILNKYLTHLDYRKFHFNLSMQALTVASH